MLKARRHPFSSAGNGLAVRMLCGPSLHGEILVLILHSFVLLPWDLLEVLT